MSYRVVVSRAARKELERLPKRDSEKVYEHIVRLGNDPRPAGCKKLVAGEGLWRIRIGDYRVVYSILDDVLTVHVAKVSHRRDAYRP